MSKEKQEDYDILHIVYGGLSEPTKCKPGAYNKNVPLQSNPRNKSARSGST